MSAMKAMAISGVSDVFRDEGRCKGTLSLNLEEAFDLIARAGGTVHGVRFTTVLADNEPLHSALILFTDGGANKTDARNGDRR
jgi:hypothetical protein